MRQIRRSIDVARPPADVFAWVADPSRYPKFFVGLHGWEPIEGSGKELGDRLRILLEIGATHSGGIVRVAEVDPPHRFAWASEVGTRHDASFEVAPTPAGSRVTMTLAFQLSGGITGRVVQRVASPIVVRVVEATLESLRHRVEWQHLPSH